MRPSPLLFFPFPRLDQFRKSEIQHLHMPSERTLMFPGFRTRAKQELLKLEWTELPVNATASSHDAH